jgi:hypothetical protein
MYKDTDAGGLLTTGPGVFILGDHEACTRGRAIESDVKIERDI